MIVENKVYSVKCDSCGKEWHNEDDHCYYPDRECICNVIEDEDIWHTDRTGNKTKHYCPDCFILDEDGDVVVLHKPKTKA